MKDYLYSVVSMLAGRIGARSWQDREALAEAEAFISREFASSGYAVKKQPVRFKGNIYTNLIAELQGSLVPEDILVIGAHYDTVRGSPGADDNASGVAGLLGLARSVARLPLPRTIRFAAFCLEEAPVFRTVQMGSYQYARSLYEAGDRVRGMICLEMIGYFSDRPASQSYPRPLPAAKYPERGTFIAMVGNIESRSFTEAAAARFRHASGLPVVTLNSPPIAAGIDFSDHWSFHQFAYPAFMVTDTAFYRNPYYHLGTDTPDTLDYRRMAQVVEGLAAAAGEWGSEG